MTFVEILVFSKKICKTKILVDTSTAKALQILDLLENFQETKILQKIKKSPEGHWQRLRKTPGLLFPSFRSKLDCCYVCYLFVIYCYSLYFIVLFRRKRW